MKTNLSRIVKIVWIQFAIISFNTTAQTNVSGGIYTDASWTIANSPYIATANLTLFPGVTLTIDPGVEVRFNDDVVFEIRGSLNALGTQADTIKFISNSFSPAPQSWVGFLISGSQGGKTAIRYCKFEFAENAIDFQFQGSSLSSISNSVFKSNIRGVYGAMGLTIDSCQFVNNEYGGVWSGNPIVSNCIFTGNYRGVASSYQPVITDCIFCGNNQGLLCRCDVQNTLITHNGVGIYSAEHDNLNLTNCTIVENDTGIVVQGTGNTLNQNNICNNTVNIIYTQNQNTQLTNNCWCTTDSLSITSKIHDGYDDVSLGLIDFTPLIDCDTSDLPPAYSCASLATGIDPIKQPDFSIILHPNPMIDFSVLKVNKKLTNAQLIVTNLMGQNVLNLNNLSGSEFTIHKNALTEGLYIVRVRENGKMISNSKIVVH